MREGLVVVVDAAKSMLAPESAGGGIGDPLGVVVGVVVRLYAHSQVERYIRGDGSPSSSLELLRPGQRATATPLCVPSARCTASGLSPACMYLRRRTPVRYSASRAAARSRAAEPGGVSSWRRRQWPSATRTTRQVPRTRRGSGTCTTIMMTAVTRAGSSRSTGGRAPLAGRAAMPASGWDDKHGQIRKPNQVDRLISHALVGVAVGVLVGSKTGTPSTALPAAGSTRPSMRRQTRADGSPAGGGRPPHSSAIVALDTPHSARRPGNSVRRSSMKPAQAGTIC